MDKVVHYDRALLEKSKFKNMGRKIMVALFFKHSIRIRLSFETTMHSLGAIVVTISELY